VPKDKLPFVKTELIQNPPVYSDSASPPRVPANTVEATKNAFVNGKAPPHSEPLSRPSAEAGSAGPADRFQRSPSERPLAGHVNAGESFAEGASGLFAPKQALLQRVQAEVRELLQSLLPELPRQAPLASPKNPPQNSSKMAGPSGSLPLMDAHASGGKDPGATLPGLSIRQEWSAQNAGENFLKGSLQTLNLPSEGSTFSASTLPTAPQAFIASVQRLLQSLGLPLNFQVPSQGYLAYPSAQQSEGMHLIQWSAQLGISPQSLHALLPFLAQFQDLTAPARPLLQGMMLLFGMFASLPQQSISNLSWVLLRGMMILETQAQAGPLHSPLLDELGALLSTSRRRLKKEAKKRLSSVDKVSRKDASLLDANPEEEDGVEALIDLWPKKESNNSSMAFYYM